jgi:hypothetical protein
MVLGYIPHLGFGKGKAKKQTSDMKLLDEHNSLSSISNQIVKIHNGGGFWTEVMGRCVCVKLWIHLIAGDTSGHNNIVGHMNGGCPKYIILIENVSLKICPVPYQITILSHQSKSNKHI